MTSHPDWRPATPDEVSQYYEREFPDYTNDIPEWVSPPGPKQYAVALSHRFPVASDRVGDDSDPPEKDFIRRELSELNDPWQTWDELAAFFAHPAANDVAYNSGTQYQLADPDTVAKPRPCTDAAYYSLDHHERWWVLAFDIDAKDCALERLRADDDDRWDGEILSESRVATQPPTGDAHDATFQYTYQDIFQAFEYAFELKSWLESHLNCTDVRVFYSGQGAHVYVLDQDKWHRYTFQARKFIANYVEQNLGIPIDPPVTTDDSRVLRVPRSLHTDVSRVVTRIQSPDFDPRTDPRAIPEFLQQEVHQ